ncbi:MAG: alpha/beta fold hydrolase [Solirubrobacteraceae bacterium]
MEVIERHERAGRYFEANGVRSFVLDKGRGDPVVCLHGVPTSSFMYRKLVHELAARSVRGIAFDLPGLGLADRPEDFDYTWTGLGRFCAEAVDALGLEAFHLVVHDIGGPVGFELARAMPERIRSLTLLNTIVEVDTFHRPPVMEPFARPGVGELALRSLNKPAFRLLMRAHGIAEWPRVVPAEIDAYVDLLKRDDGGAAFLKIMRGFERTPAKRAHYVSALRDVPYPVQIVWGVDDPWLTLRQHARQARRAARIAEIYHVPAKHFLAEERPARIANYVTALAWGRPLRH